MAYPRRDIAHSCASVSVTSTSQVLVADNPGRMSLRIEPDAAADVYIKLATAPGVDPTATADADSICIPTGGAAFERTDYTGPVAMITATTASCNVTEI